jgi:hypothetical protein
MIRRTLQSALCLCLSPLLAAQQVGLAEDPARGVTPTETFFAYRTSINLPAALGFEPAHAGSDDSPPGLSIVPFDSVIELTPVDPAVWANATIGSTITFRAVYDVIERRRESSYADVYAGNLIEAKVVRMREGKIRTRNGRAEPRVKEVMVEKYIRLELESSPRGRTLGGITKNLAVWPMKVICMVGETALLWVALLIFCRTGCDL